MEKRPRNGKRIMKINRIKTLALCLASLCLAGWGWAQPNPNPNVTQPGPPAAVPGKEQKTRLVALRIVGSAVKSPQGEYLGRIEEAAINPKTGRMEFAMLQIYYPTNTSRITPVPWKVLNYFSDQSQTGGMPGAVQTFILNMTRAQLERAPTLDRMRWPDLMESYWAERIYAYYGVQPSGGMEMSSAARPPGMPSGPERPLPQPPYEAEPYPSSVSAAGASANIVSTNEVVLPTNQPPMQVVFPGATNQLFNTNIFVNRTNFFLNNTNFFPGTKTPFNPDVPSTFPMAGGNTNFNPFVATNFTPGPVVTTNGSPFSPRFPVTSNFAGLPAPISGNSPWSPQFLSPQMPAQLPLNPQPNPWSPRFISPQAPGTPMPTGPDPNPWSPRFLNPASGDPSGPIAMGPSISGDPTGGFSGGGSAGFPSAAPGGVGSGSAGSPQQASPWTPFMPGPAQVAPRAPIRVAPAVRRR
jgi:hypothetical protein